MKAVYVAGLSMVAGAVLGATAIQGLHAQAKPPVYAVIEFDEITDPVGYAAIGGRSNEAAAAVFKNFGGRFLARTDNIKGLDGIPPKRLAIAAFDSAEKLQAWYNSPEQKKVTDIRMKTTKSRVFIAEGL